METSTLWFYFMNMKKQVENLNQKKNFLLHNSHMYKGFWTLAKVMRKTTIRFFWDI